MLSSGTLNLKFMKRNLGATSKLATNEKNEAPTEAEAPSLRPHQDRKGKQRQAETKVVYEDSLMGFPVIYGFSGPGDDVSSSAFAGRRSFGNFNIAVEQLGKASSKPLPPASLQQPAQTSRSHDVQSSNSTKAKRDPSKSTHVKLARSNPKPATGGNSNDVPPSSSKDLSATVGFQKPFQNASIKPNPKKRRKDSKSQGIADSASSSQRKKQKSQSSMSPAGNSKLTKDGRSSSSSDESEVVKRDIERMFLECRESNHNR